MKNIFFIKIIVLVFFLSGCQTIKIKSDQILKKENEKLSKFIGQPETELKILMGKPYLENKDNKGNRILIYKNKN